MDVEQIGHVYEGLLDHTAVRANAPVLGLIGTKDKEPEVSLDELEAMSLKGEDDLIKYLKQETGRSPAALRKACQEGINGDETPLPVNSNAYQAESRFLVACQNDIELWKRIKPFASLIRLDTFGYPLIIPQGSIYVTQGSDRRETGTHYTPKSLTEEIVRYTLEPLVYNGVTEGKPKEEWQLKPAEELLKLKICDMAMGSGAFLVQVCRYLGERLVEAWEGQRDEDGGRKESRTNSSLIPHNSSLKTSFGFDALVGNPPFMGGGKISDMLGRNYRDYAVEWIASNKKGSADLCAYFFLRGQQLTNRQGGFGLVATNTIAQGDTREVGLDQLVAKGCIIPRAVSSRKWEGTASLEVAYIWLRQDGWKGEFILDENHVSGITPYLSVPGQSAGNPYQLLVNQNKAFKGHNVYGMGFVLTHEEAKALIEKELRNKDVLFPYLNGEDLNSNPDQSPSRWVINFFDWALDAEHDDPKKPKGHPYAGDYPDILKIVEEKVKPERDNNQRKVRRERWWQYGDYATGLEKAIAGRDRVLVKTQVSSTWAFQWMSTGKVFEQRLVIFAGNYFYLLQSTFHCNWAQTYGSTLKKDMQYTPSSCFETFPFPNLENKPELKEKLEQIGETYYSDRQNIMQTRQEGLTKTYNRFHNPNEDSEDIQTLRQLHVEMDCVVAAAYEWGNIDLNHNFHQTKQGLRYTICEEARREILDRLLELNHQRYAEEVALGLHDKKKKSGGKKKPKIEPIAEQQSLF